MLCHLLERFDIVHVLAEAFLSSPWKCPDSPVSTIYCTEFHHIPLPTPTQLHLSIFAFLVSLLNLPVHSLKQACQNIPVRFCSWMVKNCHVLDTDRNFWQILLFHHCPNSSFISFICSPSVKTEGKIPLKNLSCHSLLWIIQYPLVIQKSILWTIQYPFGDSNQTVTACGIMHSI